MVKDASSYYLLGYTASSPTDGRFKQIRVRVKRPGLQVRHRRGYWALTNDDVKAVAAAASRPEAPADVGAALATIETPLRAHTIRIWVGTARGENGKTAVTLVWEPAPPLSGERRDPIARIGVTAGGQTGASYFRGKVPQNAPEPAAGAASGDTPGGAITFQAPPGPVQMRLTVEGAAGQTIDSDFRDVVVPDYAKADPQLSVPALFRARTQRDVNLLATDPAARPSTAREFSRTERLHVRFQAYVPGGGTAAPTARLLNRTGAKISDVPVKPTPARSPSDFDADVPLASLPPGDYLLEVALPGDPPVRQLVAFRVTS
jgi:hypothetical protein